MHLRKKTNWRKINHGFEDFRKQIIETIAVKGENAEYTFHARLCEELQICVLIFYLTKSQRLLAIGYNVSDHRETTDFMTCWHPNPDLHFLAIAQETSAGQLFALGRQLTNPGTSPILFPGAGLC